ncbi:lipase 3-like [Tribolium madens]|uniref:lipase 3-like n=1 Tax=Tribolium madens TaxID=41895 RepID=UPI001CF75428|nr:lipase 3-like [Tribolium madens]
MLTLMVFSLMGLVHSSAIPPNNLRLDYQVLSDQEDAKLSVPEIINKYGYPCEEYHVITPDNYILTLHRIPHGRTPNNHPKEVAYLQHGILSSSADWIISGPEKGLAYVLADEGYDVWMGNARGNKLSRNHTYLNPDTSDEFWDFSWHEIGYYDIPTMIDFVLEQTGKDNLFHIGHSQGTTTFYVMTSMRPDYNAKIKAHFSLAPIAYMNHMTSPLMHLIAFWEKPLNALLNLIGIREFLPSNEFISMGGNILCGDDSLTQILCKNALFAICGFSPKEMNGTLLPIMSGHTPAGASTKQFMHYAQEINSGYFRRFSYGWFENLQKYGSIRPPSYDLKKITAPVYLLYSKNDWLAGKIDVDRLYKSLANVKGRFLVAEESFNHLDFVFGIRSRELIYNKLISLMAKH